MKEGATIIVTCYNTMKGASSIKLHCDHATGLSILYYNARSLLPKLDELHSTALSQKPDLICIVETWLSDNVNDNELLLPDASSSD